METTEQTINRDSPQKKKQLLQSLEVAFFISDIAIVIINVSPHITSTLLQLMTYFPHHLTVNLCLSLLKE